LNENSIIVDEITKEFGRWTNKGENGQ